MSHCAEPGILTVSDDMDAATNVPEPPNSLEQERSVLRSMLVDPACIPIATKILSPESFYLPGNGLLFAAMARLYNSDVPVDLTILHRELDRSGTLASAGGFDYLTGLMDAGGFPANIEHYCRAVRDCAVLRSLMRLSWEMISACGANDAESDEVLGRMQSGLAAISRGRTGAISSVSWHAAATSLLAEVESVLAGSADSHLTTGFVDLDKLIGGFRPGQLVLLAGRTSQGKSTWATNLAVDLACRREKPVALMSLEMSQFEVASTVMSLWAKVPPSAMNDPKTADVEALTLLRDAAMHSEGVPLWLTCHAGLSLSDLRAEARRYRQEHGIVLLVVDYLGLVGVPHERGRHREGEVAEISRALKAIAGELGIVVLALTQLNRGPDSDQREPRLSDLRESGSQEQDADMVLFLHRPHGADPTDNAVKLIVAKNRTGPTGDVALVFRKAWRQFANAETREEMTK